VNATAGNLRWSALSAADRTPPSPCRPHGPARLLRGGAVPRWQARHRQRWSPPSSSSTRCLPCS